jgi:site-specific DNA-cytosine methylase
VVHFAIPERGLGGFEEPGVFREQFQSRIEQLGYRAYWRLLNASDFGVPQLRPRVVFVALESGRPKYFTWSQPIFVSPPTVGEALYEMIAARGWRGAGHRTRTRPRWLAAAASTAGVIEEAPRLSPSRQQRNPIAMVGQPGNPAIRNHPNRDLGCRRLLST